VILGAFSALITQAADVRLRGRVLDENNTPLSGAEITLKLSDIERHAFSDPTGDFAIEARQPGDYSVKVSLPGYFDLQDRKVHLEPGANELTLVLSRVRDSLESMDVSGATANIDLDKSAPEQRLSGAELMEVPYPNNNDLRNAMRILPGVVQDSQGGIHVNGAAEQQVLYTLDGFNVTDPLTGTFQTKLSVEAVQSMSVLSGPLPAEYGKGAAGVLAVNTKQGADHFLYSATNFIPGVAYRNGLMIDSWSPRFNLSGPIYKGKVWFSDSLGLQYDNNYVWGLPAGQNRNSSWLGSNMLRAQVNLTESNILYAGFLADLWWAPKSGLSALDPTSTTVNRNARQWFYDLRDQIYLGRGSLVEFGFATNQTYANQTPQGNGLYLYTPNGRAGNYYIDGTQTSGRDQWITNYFLPSFELWGSHQIKTGIDLDRLTYWQNIDRTGFIDYSASNVPVRQVLYSGNGRFGRSDFEYSGYVQDSWRVRPGLMFELGLRTDRDTILQNWNVGPRTGFVWGPGKKQRTKISGGYGIIYDATNLVLFTRPLDQFPITTLYPPYVGSPLTTVADYILDRRHLLSPRYQNINLSIERELSSSFVARVQTTFRLGDHGLSYFDTTGLAPQTIYTLQDGRHDKYEAVEFTIRQHIRRQFEWLASYTRARALSNAVVDLNSDQPLIVPNNSGPLPWDAPNRFLSWGFLPTLWKSWSLAYLMDWRTGFPFSIVNARGLVLGGADSTRFPNYFELDLHAERTFELRGQRWAWRFGVNNITNHMNPQVVNNDTDSLQFLRFYGAPGRSLNMRIRWLGKTQ
jgi:hypothetical protein